MTLALSVAALLAAALRASRARRFAAIRSADPRQRQRLRHCLVSGLLQPFCAAPKTPGASRPGVPPADGREAAGRGFAPQTRPGAGAPSRLGAADARRKRRAHHRGAMLVTPTLSLLLWAPALLASSGFGSPRSLAVGSGGSLGLAPPLAVPKRLDALVARHGSTACEMARTAVSEVPARECCRAFTIANPAAFGMLCMSCARAARPLVSAARLRVARPVFWHS